MILLAQLNREGWKKANRNEGAYDITALADANELERGSFRVFTIYTNEDMKARGSAQVQILKNRSGQTMYEPAQISVVPAAYVITDEEIGANSSFGADVGTGFSLGLNVSTTILINSSPGYTHQCNISRLSPHTYFIMSRDFYVFLYLKNFSSVLEKLLKILFCT